MAAAYSALDLGGRVACFEDRRRWLWLLAGALAMGTGIWSAHFVALRAQTLPAAAALDPLITLLSWLPACAASLLVLRLIARTALPRRLIPAGGVLMGLGITAMYLVGIAAMRLAPAAHYDRPLLAVSALVATLGATAALAIAVRAQTLPEAKLAGGRLASALVMGLAICGQHVIAVAATTLPAGVATRPGATISIAGMGLPVAVLTCLMLLSTVWLSVLDLRLVAERRRVGRARAEAERLHRLASYDSVTALPNRSLFTEKLLKQLVSAHDAEGPATPVGLVYAELRNYRGLVEQHGSERMNRILKTLAAQLSRQLRPGDLLARLSSDALILMVREQDDSHTTAAALGAFSALLSTPLQDGDDAFRFHWGLGSSRYPDHGNSAQGLIRAAMRTDRQVGAETAVPAAATPRYAMAS
ncbi:MAG: hypothetical protein NVS9B10_20650 [Nevskia sp.]